MERDDSGEVEREDELARSYLEDLSEETMVRAWGERMTPEGRRRVVLAAIIFGRQFDERFSEQASVPDERETQRLLMGLINGVITEFARRENLDLSEATEFLGDVEVRDYVLEFNEVLDAHNAAEPGYSLNEQFKRAIDDRRERAIWSQHWSSG